jgi:hypothetical protein
MTEKSKAMPFTQIGLKITQEIDILLNSEHISLSSFPEFSFLRDSLVLVYVRISNYIFMHFDLSGTPLKGLH